MAENAARAKRPCLTAAQELLLKRSQEDMRVRLASYEEEKLRRREMILVFGTVNPTPSQLRGELRKRGEGLIFGLFRAITVG